MSMGLQAHFGFIPPCEARSRGFPPFPSASLIIQQMHLEQESGALCTTKRDKAGGGLGSRDLIDNSKINIFNVLVQN